ncbi:DUF4865 family protein [Streptomyces beihaiensis]|uniref:DUF4865 family protein n=1 Tax=Streptomyces beihaiensis TaxID=2984495 RepID=A0ABT3TYW9_9ACTN|nr:DUF4865 family protein [Streptomyces beihaiensis]MCX3062240.1 DUF4865 family protein [Streptomyces beihaiensis]
MHAMQYEMTLPADYDMDIIRNRVAAKGHLLDDHPGLGAKAYLMRVRGERGSPVNLYGSFYLWASPQGMNSFLWGPGFQGVVNDFGRPVVQHWTGLAYEAGPATATVARSAVRRRTPVEPGADLAATAADAVDEVTRLAAGDGVLYAAAGVDPRTWERVTFSVWAHGAPEAPGDVYQVLHVSQPERGRLTAGRQW